MSDRRAKRRKAVAQDCEDGSVSERVENENVRRRRAEGKRKAIRRGWHLGESGPQLDAVLKERAAAKDVQPQASS